jgi:hypothetical protein
VNLSSTRTVAVFERHHEHSAVAILTSAQTVHDRVKLEQPFRDIHHQIECLVVGQVCLVPVQVQENHRRKPCQPFVAIDQHMTAGKRMQKRRNLQRKLGVGVAAERR